MTVRYLLDTNIVSEVIKPQPEPKLLAWLGRQPDEELGTSSTVLAEIWRGILQLPGRRRRDLEAWFMGGSGPRRIFAGRILPFDEDAALAWGELMAEGHRLGQPRSGPDMLVAATAIVHRCTLVTRNLRHFSGLGQRFDLLDPAA